MKKKGEKEDERRAQLNMNDKDKGKREETSNAVITRREHGL